MIVANLWQHELFSVAHTTQISQLRMLIYGIGIQTNISVNTPPSAAIPARARRMDSAGHSRPSGSASELNGMRGPRASRFPSAGELSAAKFPECFQHREPGVTKLDISLDQQVFLGGGCDDLQGVTAWRDSHRLGRCQGEATGEHRNSPEECR